MKRKPGIIDYKAKGFYTVRAFYSPDHINDLDFFNKTNLSTTLYWQPIIKTSRNTNTDITFYTSDIKSDYIIEVEGISDKGIPISAVKTFNVE